MTTPPPTPPSCPNCGAQLDAAPLPHPPLADLHPRDRPAVLQSSTRRVKTSLGNLYVTIGRDGDARPFEVFAAIHHSGTEEAAYAEAVCRMISLALRSGVAVDEVISQLRGITSAPVWDKGVKVCSVADGIALAFELELGKGRALKSPDEAAQD